MNGEKKYSRTGNRIRQQQIVPEDFGRIPPQNVEIEEAVLGAILLENTYKEVKYLKPEMFYKETHKIIFEAVIDIHKEGGVVDILTVTNMLKKKQKLDLVGGAYYITQLTNRVATSAHIDYHARLIYQYFIQREILRVSHETIKNVYDEKDIFDIIDLTKKEYQELLNPIRAQEKVSSTEVSQKYITHFDEEGESEESGIKVYKTGWVTWDKFVETTANKIILVAGAAGDGKTKLVTNWMFRVLKNYPDEVAIKWVSLEDDPMVIASYFFSSMTMLTKKEIMRKRFNQRQKEFLMALNKNLFSKFKIDYIKRAQSIDWICDDFELFVTNNQDRFCILVIDNILSLSDRKVFGKDLNTMYDYVMDRILQCRQNTEQLIIPIHHFRDSQMNKEHLATGYRPSINEMKGTEAFRRIPNQVLLINTPSKRKDLMQEYYGEKKEILEHTMIIDPGKVRDDDNSDDASLMYMYADLGYSIFYEIPRKINENLNEK